MIVKLPDWMWLGEWQGFAFFTIVFIRYDSPSLLRHEQAHVEQWRKEPLTFHIKYLWYLFKVGYKNNPYEIAARKSEEE